MKIVLSTKLEKLVREKIDAGLYSEPSEVILAALEQMHERDEKQRIKAVRLLQALDEGLKDIAEGRFETFETPEDLERFFKTL